MVKEIKVRLLKIDEPSFFHDSRRDARTLAKAVNMLIDKVNELVKDNNSLREELLKTK